MRRVVLAGEKFVSLTHNIAATLLAISAVLVFLQVVSRFGGGHSLAWTEIFARGTVIWMVFMAACAGFRLNAMIPLEFIRDVVPAPAKKAVLWAVFILTLIFLFVMSWYGTQMAMRVVNQKIAMIGISMAWFYAAIPVGCVCALPGVLLGHFCPVMDERLPE
ncbi:TRAP transporter small permease [Brucella thiophenivorans]|uniref:TRAP transporter small permease protein n=1 Tax=Brucella thiophenivorans TaxID=571255 RepID=A0A256FBV1_9HYPH|nr:TRAP transporter small permease [Brucella thiophenivorans]OYR12253.1 tripartite ATP-independent periplasmic transporter, DctQ family [Brucella thiophenivorans]